MSENTIRLERGTTKTTKGHEVTMVLPARTLRTPFVHGKNADDVLMREDGRLGRIFVERGTED